MLAMCLLGVLTGCKDEQQDRRHDYAVPVIEWTEGDADAVIGIPIVRSGSIGHEHAVGYQIQPLSAKLDADIAGGQGTIVFKSGKSESIIPVTLRGDDHFELREDFQILITDQDRTLTVTVTIVDDDSMAPLVMDGDGYRSASEYPSMETVWQEEFTGDALNAADWNVETGNGCDQGICGWGNDELQLYSGDARYLKVGEGRLVITADRSGDLYRSARIQTRGKKEFTFGRIDMRARLPEGKGLWPAFWMLGSSIATKPWPACGEIDIMESLGQQPEVVHGTVHYSNNGYATSTGSTSLVSGDFSDAFHVFTLIWERNKLVWYVDQQPFKTFQNNGIAGWPFNDPFYFVLNIAVGGRWPGAPDQTTVFPQSMEVDYIRVFR